MKSRLSERVLVLTMLVISISGIAVLGICACSKGLQAWMLFAS